ncbi:unnamed protein product [Eruca vesicaria subsp. sativa]|uniref:Cytochrome P450 n=1 Tax=Eruca vesicaria subsp. sativa TaxID=29727 RepID=A0ABC8M5T4_ERUVS|nr:unnamed protein product [Eruca vesicaria subsp. sativa]
MEKILISLCLTTLLAFLFLKQLFKRTTTTKLNPPPSPWRLPIIGNFHQLSLSPHRSFRSLSLRYGPLMLLHFGRVPVLVVSSAEVAHDVMKTHDRIFANRPITKAVDKVTNGGRDLVFAPYGIYWRNIKSLCIVHLLTNKMVRSFQKGREEEINLMMEYVEKASSSSSTVNLSQLFITLTSDVMSKVALGRKYSSDQGTIDIKTLVRTFAQVLGTFPVADYIPSLAWIDWIRRLDGKVEEVSKTFDDFLEKVVQEHDADAEKKRSGFVDTLLSIQRQKMTPFIFEKSDIKLIILDMFIGGTATTSSLLEWMMTELMRHPECMKKLRDEICSVSTHSLYVNEEDVEKMNYLNAVIKETLRLHPPLSVLLPRQLSEDIKLKGYDIAAGTQVIINAWAIQRDNATWGPDAEEFKPERHLNSSWDFQGQDFKFLPFGSGRRLCPGIRLALVLVEVTLANLVKRFDWRVQVGPHGVDKPDLAEAAGIEACRKFPLIMILISLCLATLLAFLFLKQLFKRITTTKLNPPPSPWRLPIIGNFHQLSLYPHRSFRSLSLRYGPLMLLHFGRVPVLVVSSAEVAHDVMKTHDRIFANRPMTKAMDKVMKGGRDIAFAPYGEYWRNMKTLCIVHLLTNKMVRSFHTEREEEINILMEKLEEASSSFSTVNLSQLFITLTSDVMSKVALGRKYSSDEGTVDIKTVVRTFARVFGTFPVAEYIPSLAWIDWIRRLDGKAEEVSRTFDDFLEKVVQEHDVDADNKRSGFVETLLSIQREKTTPFFFDRSDIKLIIMDMFIGGTATTSSLLEWTMTELMRHPECVKKLRDEICSVSMHNSYVNEEDVEKMNYLNAIIKETLRLHPPLSILVPRLLSEDVRLRGYDITAGTQVMINAWAIQRDNATWGPDAEEFKPERHLNSSLDFQGQDYKFIPFGSGRRLCPGIRLASVLVEVTVANLVKRFDWRVQPGPHGVDKPDLAEAAGIEACRKYPLIVFPSSVVFPI